MKIPTVHLNGTAKQDLIDQVTDARRAVTAARRALNLAYPHGRDYYVQDRGGAGVAHRIAVNEHVERDRKLKAVEDELETILKGIFDQGPRS